MRILIFVLLGVLAGSVVRQTLAVRRLRAAAWRLRAALAETLARQQELEGERDYWCERFSEVHRNPVDGHMRLADVDEGVVRPFPPGVFGSIQQKSWYPS